MIVRVWRCETKKGQDRQFLKFLENYATPVLKKQPGCISWIFGREKVNLRNFLIITVWKDYKSLKRFTGPNWKEARIDPEEEAQLKGVPRIEHYKWVSFLKKSPRKAS